MEFINSYKRLEKLCGEILNDNRRVSAYIEEMSNTYKGKYFVSGWDEDLKQLKHYRWIRNQIAHNPVCNEENMCSYEDVQWLDNFYDRIMNQTDPLALYRKATQPRHSEPTKKTAAVQYKEKTKCNVSGQMTTRSSSGCGAALLVALVGLVAGLAIWWLIGR